MRFTVLDEFGEPIRKFYNRVDAMAYIKIRKGFKLREITLHEILGDCLL